MSTNTYRFLVVLTNSTGVAQVPAYLYRGAELLLSTTVHRSYGDTTALVVAVSGTPDAVASQAQYQADRLNSGLHATTVHDTLAEAMAQVTLRTVPAKYDTRPWSWSAPV